METCNLPLQSCQNQDSQERSSKIVLNEGGQKRSSKAQCFLLTSEAGPGAK